MAKMHSKKKGKSKSRKPVMDRAEFGKGTDKLSKEEIADLAVGYAKQGMSPAMIGHKLSTDHGVRYVALATGTRLVQLLESKGIKGEVPQDMRDLMTKAVRVRKHLERNKQDVYSRIRLIRIEAKLLRLTRYYRSRGTLPQDWKYDPQKAELIVKGKA
jgi:small subunit ribosomal protein S15